MTLPENYSFDHDDTPERVDARVRLIEKIIHPVGCMLMNEFPALHWQAGSLTQLLQQYKQFRNEARKSMDGYTDMGHLLMIDRHKIAAAFIMAILKVRPLQMRTNAQPEKLEIGLLANEILAFQSGIRILGAFSRHSDKAPTKLLDIHYPQPQADGAYKHHAYRALRHGFRENKLNLPLLAHWMFYIEKYWELVLLQQAGQT